MSTNWQSIAAALSGGLAGAVDAAGYDPTAATSPSLATAFGVAGQPQGIPVYGAPQASSGLTPQSAGGFGGMSTMELVMIGGGLLLVAFFVLKRRA